MFYIPAGLADVDDGTEERKLSSGKERAGMARKLVSEHCAWVQYNKVTLSCTNRCAEKPHPRSEQVSSVLVCKSSL